MTDKIATSEAPAIVAPKELTVNDLVILMAELMTSQIRIAAQALESQAKLNDLVIDKLKSQL